MPSEQCDNLFDAQRQHWESKFTAKPSMFGDSPSDAAQQALQVFRQAGVRNVLELGAGQGRDTLLFAESGFEVTALEYSRQGIAGIDQRAASKGLAKSIRALCHDVRQPFPLASESFDACYSHMLCCMAMTDQELDQLFAEMHRVLRPGGLSIYTVRNLHDPLYGTGIKRGQDTYEISGGFIVHFFSEAMVHRLATGCRVLSVDDFEEGSEPKRLFRVTMCKSG